MHEYVMPLLDQFQIELVHCKPIIIYYNHFIVTVVLVCNPFLFNMIIEPVAILLFVGIPGCFHCSHCCPTFSPYSCVLIIYQIGHAI